MKIRQSQRPRRAATASASGRARFGVPRRPALETLESKTLLSTYHSPLDGFLTGPQAGQPLDLAMAYLKTNGADYGLAPVDLDRLIVTDNYTDADTGTTHIYMRQGFDGLQVDNAKLDVQISGQGQIIDVGGSFDPTLGSQASAATPPAPGLSAVQAVQAAAVDLGLDKVAVPVVTTPGTGADQATILKAPTISLDPIPVHLTFEAQADGTITETWDIIIRTANTSHWYDARVDANTGAMVALDDWVDHYSETFNVFAQPTRNPQDGNRSIVTNPADPTASPYGWNDTDTSGTPTSTKTEGNNVVAYVDADASDKVGYQPDGGASLNFDFKLDLTQDPTKYQDAAVTNLYYWANLIHDLDYKYGFTEAAGNFQVNNYSNGGVGGDPVHAEAQDGEGLDNANMATPPDGTSPILQMFLWDLTSPHRDGDLESMIITHEWHHGTSNRLTGGPSDANALDDLQSGGMGEGWSDWFSLMYTMKSGETANTPRNEGPYVLGNPESGPGVRRNPYSYDMSIDPETIDWFNTSNPNGSQEVHDVGEIWCTALWDMSWNLINKYGFDPNIAKGYTGPNSGGNELALKLVMDAMKLQPANPSFKDARDAILRADQALTGGANQPEIWNAFARRGMGLSFQDTDGNATSVTPAFDVPSFLTIKAEAPVKPSEGVAFNNVEVATISDPNGGTPGSYTVTIDWGDSTTPTTGTVSQGPNNTFPVTASHTYVEGGTYTEKVTVVKSNGGGSATSTTTVSVADAPITALGTSLSMDEGDQFNGMVARFLDADPGTTDPSDYTVTIDWGDGTSSAGTVTPDKGGPGAYQVSGSHVFGAETSQVIVTIKDKGGATATATTAVSVTDKPLTGIGLDVTPQEGVPFLGPVATFSDADPRVTQPSNYTATIDWGDGTTSPGTINASGGSDFFVTGSHAYNVGTYGTSITIHDKGGATFVAPGSATVQDAGLLGTALHFNPTAGLPFAGFIVSFGDADPRPNPASNYSATIEWGDGTSAPGQILVDGDGGYIVKGSHTYATGSYTAVTTVTDVAGKASRDFTTTVTVPDAPIHARIATTATPIEGQSFTDTVATFTDEDPTSPEGDFTATIDWGDGTKPTTGTVKKVAPGQFSVSGVKTYQDEGPFTINVVVADIGGSRSSAVGKINVGDAPLAGAGVPIKVVDKTAGTQVTVANFRDGNAKAPASDFMALINWGDGQITTGTVVPDPSGVGFDVVGSHNYATSGTFNAGAAVMDKGGSIALIGTVAQVSDRLFPIAGMAMPTGGGSVSPTGVTNSNQPTFAGMAEPNSTVRLYALPVGAPNTPIPIGEGSADDSGHWSVTVNPMADGGYTIAAASFDRNGHLSGAPTVLLPTAGSGPLVVDTTGPMVAGVTIDPRTGQVKIALVDAGSGLNQAALINPNNFTLTETSGGRSITFRPTGLTVAPAAPIQAQTVTATFGNLVQLPAGTYVLQIAPGSLADNAGNSLVENFFVPFPLAYNQPSSNFTAQFGTNGQSVTPLQQYVPPNEVRAANLHARFVQSRLVRVNSIGRRRIAF